MRLKRLQNGDIAYPPEPNLFFHFSNDAPEKMLVNSYLTVNSNDTLQYHVDNSNPHCLFEKMVELGLATNQHQAFELCFNSYKNSVDGCVHFDELKQFIKGLV